MKNLYLKGLSIFLIFVLIIFTNCSLKKDTMKKIIYTKNAPEPIGPYSQAVEYNGIVYVSGQIAIDPSTSQLYSGDDIQMETRQVMENLQAIITTAGFELKNVIKCSIFLKDMNDFNEVNKVYAEYFPEFSPARETVAVAGLPKGARVEISAVVGK